jgi:RNA polymerase sigma-70 factor (ECF subfamily)
MTVGTEAQEREILSLREQGRPDEALVRLLDCFEAPVYRMCRAFLRDATWAEDVAQQSLIRIWKGLEGFDGRSSLSTWVYAIVRNRCNTALSAHRPTLDGALELEEIADEQAQDPAERDAAMMLAQIVEQLPDKFRVPVQLYYFEEESVTEVALRLGCPPGTVKTHLARAREELRMRLKAAGLGEWTLWN